MAAGWCTAGRVAGGSGSVGGGGSFAVGRRALGYLARSDGGMVAAPSASGAVQCNIGVVWAGVVGSVHRCAGRLDALVGPPAGKGDERCFVVVACLVLSASLVVSGLECDSIPVVWW